jgi:hypothetical protein
LRSFIQSANEQEASMYCPKCGHHAVSNNVRFCPGCGFRLEGVAELIANNGVFTADEEKLPKPRRSMVKRGALLGAMLMFIGSMVIMPIHTRGPDGKEAVALTFFYWVALMTLISVSGYLKRIVSKIFSEDEPSPSKKIAPPRGPALPAAHSAPVADSGRQFVDTATTRQPSSVTEQTTSRLNKV